MGAGQSAVLMRGRHRVMVRSVAVFLAFEMREIVLRCPGDGADAAHRIPILFVRVTKAHEFAIEFVSL
jgi:hypothetical protein